MNIKKGYTIGCPQGIGGNYNDLAIGIGWQTVRSGQTAKSRQSRQPGSAPQTGQTGRIGQTGSLGALQNQSGKVTVKKKINAGDYMMRIAQARTPSQVSSVMRVARADLQFVKQCNSEKADIEKAVRILKQVIAKSRLKIGRLKAEEALEKQEQLARSAKEKAHEERLREKRNRKKRSRCACEAADACNREEATVSRTTYLDTVGMGVSVQTAVTADTGLSAAEASGAETASAVTDAAVTASAGIVTLDAGSSMEVMI